VLRSPGTLRMALWMAALLATPPSALGLEGTVYEVAIIPQAPPVAMFERWGPLLARLSARTGVPLRAKLYEDMGAFERDLLAGQPDLLFAHPVMTVAAHKAQGYVPLVRDERSLIGWLFVRRDSPYRTVADLVGKRIAFVGDKSFCTSVVTRALVELHGAPVALDRSHAGSTRNTLRAVILGKADAGVSLDVALEDEPGEMRDLIRPVLTTAPHAPHPIAAHPRVPAEVRQRIAAAVLEMARSESDRRLLATVRLSRPVLADYDRDYRGLESPP